MQVLAFISGKGGVGKTTLAANIAIALGQRGKRVLAIDLDPQNSLRLHLGMDPNETAGFVREGIAAESVFDSPFGVNFIPFGTVSETELEEFETALRSRPNWVRDGIDTLDPASFDFVILDTPPGPTVFLELALHAAHRALIIILADAASFTTVPKILSLVDQYTGERASFFDANLVINQMPDQGQLGHQVRSALYENYPGRIVPMAIHRDAAVSEALAFERPVLQYEPGSKASLDIQYLCSWLLASTPQ